MVQKNGINGGGILEINKYSAKRMECGLVQNKLSEKRRQSTL